MAREPASVFAFTNPQGQGDNFGKVQDGHFFFEGTANLQVHMAHGASGDNTVCASVNRALNNFIDHGFDHFRAGNREKSTTAAGRKRPFFI